MSILRQALGTQQTHPNQVLVALSLFLTLFVMSPTLNKVYEQSGVPYLNGDIPAQKAIVDSAGQIKTFMVSNTRESDLSMFAEISGNTNFASIKEVPFSTALPAFITSELKTAFQIGFILFIPFYS